MQKPKILFRSFNKETLNEMLCCEQNFCVVNSRMSPAICENDVLIGRYSVLPFYNELENDLFFKSVKLINSFREHRYVADLKNWACDTGENGDGQGTLFNITPFTWTRLEDVPDNVGPVILKGETNSRKNRWLTHCYAENKKEAIKVYQKLREDSSLDSQEIYIRKFETFIKYFDDPINGQPITKEFRFFCYKNNILASGFYWSNFVDSFEKVPCPSCVPKEFLKKIMDVVSQRINFYVIDVAQHKNGEWMVVELNDGQCSGLSECDPEMLYKNLKLCFEK